MYPKKMFLILVLYLLFMLGLANAAYAHGVVINYTVNEETGELEFDAQFDNGEIMSNAQVTIYSPEDPATPWLTAKADENGRFAFAPDRPGQWDIQFRMAGHGDIVYINIEQVFEPTELEAESNIEETNLESDSETTTAVTEVEAKAEESSLETAMDVTNEVETDGAEASEVVAMAHDGHSDIEKVADVEASNTESAVDSHVAESEVKTAKEPIAETEQLASPRIVVSSSGSSNNTGGFTVFQIIVMSASVIWGFIGTALYFQSKRSN